MFTDKLRELRELLAKATPGQWSLSGTGFLLTSERHFIGDGVYGPDAALIAAMHEAMPELLAIAEAAEDLRADAMRYRFLRNDPPSSLCVRTNREGCQALYTDGENLDAAIDAALSTVAPVREGTE